MEATLLKRIRGSLWLAALVAAGLFAFAACGDGAAAADGTVRAVGSDTLEIDTEEGPATILIDRDTEIEDQDGSRVDLEAITPGVEVRVRGDLREDGSIMAERIEVTLELPEGTPEGVSEATPEGVLEETPEGVSEETPEGVSEGTPEGTPEGISEGTPEGVSGELEFEGEVTAVTGGNLTVTTSAGDVTVTIGSDTEVDGQILPGVMIKVHGARQADGSILAREIDVLAAEGD